MYTHAFKEFVVSEEEKEKTESQKCQRTIFDPGPPLIFNDLEPPVPSLSGVPQSQRFAS
jgi:hypothetical protein